MSSQHVQPQCVEEKAAQALTAARSSVFEAQAALEDWRHIYSSRHVHSRRAGDKHAADLANSCYTKIDRLVMRCITLLGKIEDVQTGLLHAEREINPK